MKSYGTRSDGTPITDEQIQAWVAEAETGYDVAELKKRGRPRLGPGASTVVPVRLDPELNTALTDRADVDHATRSDIIREALRTYLTAAQHGSGVA